MWTPVRTLPAIVNYRTVGPVAWITFEGTSYPVEAWHYDLEPGTPEHGQQQPFDKVCVAIGPMLLCADTRGYLGLDSPEIEAANTHHVSDMNQVSAMAVRRYAAAIDALIAVADYYERAYQASLATPVARAA